MTPTCSLKSSHSWPASRHSPQHEPEMAGPRTSTFDDPNGTEPSVSRLALAPDLRHTSIIPARNDLDQNTELQATPRTLGHVGELRIALGSDDAGHRRSSAWNVELGQDDGGSCRAT